MGEMGWWKKTCKDQLDAIESKAKIKYNTRVQERGREWLTSAYYRFLGERDREREEERG